MTGYDVPCTGSQRRPDELDEARLVAALRAGDEHAFATVVDRIHPALLRYATTLVSDRSVAEEIVQETWLALVRRVDRFEGRSSLRTWLFRVLTYQARQRMEHDHARRAAAFADLAAPSADPSHLTGREHWSPAQGIDALSGVDDTPEALFLRQETMVQVRDLIAQLPARQRVVLVLRDVEGLSSRDTCHVLGMSDGALRVSLHRARARVRRGIESYLRASGA